MIGVVDVGGGTRGIYGAGVFDYCLEKGIWFDFFAGVSAGSANGAAYLAGQKGRNIRFYNEYAFRKEYMSMRNFLRKGSYIDLDYVYSTLCNSDGEDPLDYAALQANPAQLLMVATDAYTGEPYYFKKEDLKQDQYDAFKASSCVPVICKPCRVGDRMLYDGGISDPMPFQKCFETGCERVVIVLTRPREQWRSQGKDAKFAKLIKKKYPGAAEALANRYETYNKALREAFELEQEGKVLIIAPDDISGLKTLSQDHVELEKLYQKGYRDAQKIEAFLEK